MNWRRVNNGDKVMWVCDHGITHPDTKSIAVMCGFDAKLIAEKNKHACDGCCTRDDFPGKINIENFKKQ
jgi:hypothetical protein